MAVFSSLVDLSSFSQPDHNSSIEDIGSVDKFDVKNQSITQLKANVKSVRWPLSSSSRVSTWLSLLQHHVARSADAFAASVAEYHYIMEEISSCQSAAEHTDHSLMPSFIPSACLVHVRYLNERGRCTLRGLLQALARANVSLTYCPLVYHLSMCMLHVMPVESVYCSVTALLKRADNPEGGDSNEACAYITQTRRSFHASLGLLICLAEHYLKDSLAFILVNAKPLDFFANWYYWIFVYIPLIHTYRIIDFYLIYGHKILYRAALALVLMFHKYLLSQHKSRRVQLSNIDDVNCNMRQFCEHLQCTPRKLTRRMFKFRQFGRSKLRRLGKKIASEAFSLDTPALCDFQPTQQPSVKSNIDFLHLKQANLHLANFEQLVSIWQHTPQRYELSSVTPLFSTHEHGYSLTTLLSRAGDCEPTVILVRATSSHVFGAYCSTRWSTRHVQSTNTFFGTGENFVFSLSPQSRFFHWVGSPRSQCYDANCTNTLFQFADSHSLLLGGGGQGYAMRLDEGLNRGESAACATFANTPLAGESTEFTVAEIEIFTIA